MKIHDISRTIRQGIGVWPGDTDFDFGLVARIAEGSSVNVGRVEMSVHTGTHIDAPFHFDDAGAGASDVDLAKYIGPCVVADVRPKGADGDQRGILPAHLPEGLGDELSGAPRVLLRSYAERPEAFDESMCHATPELADWLAEHGVVLLGVDTDSMDAFESKELPAHQRLNHHGIAILEGMDLSGVPAGRYELVALPLKIEGADGSPVRAILIER